MVNRHENAVSRRRFLALCGGGIAGIWLAGTGFVALPNEMVFAISGSCSFCGKEASEIFGLVGVTRRSDRICNECIELCFDILAEEVDKFDFDVAIATARSQLIEDLQHRVLSGDQDHSPINVFATLRTQVEELEKILKQPVPKHSVGHLICSFCNKHHDKVAKLIAGPTVYICDGCVGDAGALFMRYGWRPST